MTATSRQTPGDGTESADPGTEGAGGLAGDPTRQKAGQLRREHVRGSSLLVLGRILTLVLTTATQVVVVRALTKEEFGAFAYALAFAAAGRILLSLGQGRMLSRFMAKYEERREYDRMFGSMFLAVGTILVTSTIAMLTLFVFADELIGSTVQDPAITKVVFILLFLAPLEALDQVFVSLFAVFSRPTTIFFRKYILTPGLRLIVVLALAVTGASVSFLAIGYLAAGVVGMVVYLLVFVKVLRERGLLGHLRMRRIVLPFREVFSFSTPMITGELLQLSIVVGGVVILAYHHSAEEVANYRAVFNPARLNTAVLAAFVPLFLPLAARLFERGDIDGLRRTYWHTGAFVAVLTFPVFALTGPLATEFSVLLFGARYEDAGVVLAILSVGYYFSTVLGFNAYTLQVCGWIRFQVLVNIVAAVANIGVSLLLVQRYGAVAIAVATLVTLVVQNLVNQWALRRALGTAFIDRSCAVAYLTIVLAAAALWGFQALVEPGLVIGVLAAVAVSLVVLVVSRSALELEDVFPELRRVPVVRWLIRGPARKPVREKVVP
jgi:O-antigen/teichoic acid export membrane protein